MAPLRRPDMQALFSLIPFNDYAQGIVNSPENHLRICETEGISGQIQTGLDIGFHVQSLRSPFTLATIGRRGDILVPNHTDPDQENYVSSIQCSFELNISSSEVYLQDLSSNRNTSIIGCQETAFENHRSTRKVLLDEETNTRFGFGGQTGNLYIFDIVWHSSPQTILGHIIPAIQSRGADRRTPDLQENLPIRYHRRHQLGKGGFGKVFEAVNLDTADVLAVKRILMPAANSTKFKYLESEVAIMRDMSNDHIMKLVAEQRSEDGYSEIFMPKMQDSARQLHKNGFFATENSRIEVLMSHMWQALDHLAHKNLMHMDFKAKNILYKVHADGSLHYVLSDFGLSFYTTQTLPPDIGVKYYYAPELTGKRAHRQSTTKADIWSLYFALLRLIGHPKRKFPQKASERFALIENARQDRVTRGGILFNLRGMAEKSPKKRVSAGTLLQCFFQGVGRSTVRDEEAENDFLLEWQRSHTSVQPSMFDPAL